MSETYYYTVNGEIFGPHSKEEVKFLLSQGTVNAQSMFCPVGQEQWLPLSQIASLAALLSRPQSQAQPQRKTTRTAAPRTSASAMPAMPQAQYQAPRQTMDYRPAYSGSEPVPGSAAFMNAVAWVIVCLTVLGTVVTLCKYDKYDYDHFFSQIMISTLAGLFGGLLIAFLFFALRDILTWLYNIMLNTKGMRR